MPRKRDKRSTPDKNEPKKEKKAIVYASREQRVTLQDAFSKSQASFTQEELERLAKDTGLTQAWIRRWAWRERQKTRIMAIKEEEKEAQLSRRLSEASPQPEPLVTLDYNPAPSPIRDLHQNLRNHQMVLEIPDAIPKGTAPGRFMPQTLPCLSSVSPPPSPSLYARPYGQGKVHNKAEPNKHFFPSMGSASTLHNENKENNSVSLHTRITFPSNLQSLLAHLPSLTPWLTAQISSGQCPTVDETVDRLLQLNQTLVTEDPVQATVALLFVNRSGLNW